MGHLGIFEPQSVKDQEKFKFKGKKIPKKIKFLMTQSYWKR